MASSTMYSCPRFNGRNDEMALPTCMYEMKNIQESSDFSMMKASISPQMSDLLQRQTKILQDLENVKRQIDLLQMKAGITEQDFKNASKIETEIPTAKKMQDEDLDIVMTATPSNPPLSAFIIFNYLKQNGVNLSCTCHKHSSVKQPVPFDLMKLIGWKDSIVQTHNKLVFTFIWKEDQFGPSLIVSPRIQTPIMGDSNIARFLCRKFAPHLYESLGENDLLLADFFMELSTSKILNGSVEDTKKALDLVEKQVGRKSWLVADQMTIADVVVFSALKISKKTKLLSQSLQKWYKKIAEKYC